MTFTVAILTVSDTAFANPATDRSGPLLRDLLSSLPSSPYSIISAAVVPDDPDEIRRTVEAWCDGDVNLVLTTGGTGFGVRDKTPEALTPLIDKPAPGLVALMLSHSLSITPLAALSRPVAGVRLSPNSLTGRGSLIVTLPGSPKGAKENLESLLRVLPHALELAGGDSGKATHTKLATVEGRREIEAGAVGATVPVQATAQEHHHHHAHGHSHSHGHSHDHSHGTHGHAMPKPRTLLSLDPSTAVANRQRHSPYPLVPLRDALSLIFQNTFSTPLVTLAVDEKLVGYVLGEDVLAAKDVPERPTTNVDGYAVRSTDHAGVYAVLTEYPAGAVPEGSVYRINTGAPLPLGTDSVIMVEDTTVHSRHEGEEGEEKEVELLAQVDKRENVRKAGSDVRQGEKVLEEGDVVSAVGGEIGTLAFVGRKGAKVHRRPIVAVLSTGNELIPVSNTRTLPTSSFSLIPDSNRPSLLSILNHLHFDTIDLGIVGDTMEATTRALKKGREEADVIISTGGTSMGVGDLLKPCIERELTGTVHFGRVAMKPGKPTTFATLPAHPMAPDRNPKLVFALPGNPASALVTFFIFVLPALRKMEGRREEQWELPRVPVQISSAIHLDSRPEYHRVYVRPNSGGGRVSLEAVSTGSQRSSRTVSLAGSNGLLELPARREGELESYPEGEVVSCVMVGEIGC